MSLLHDHTSSAGSLNVHIFADVLDEIIGWLNMYKAYDIIQFAGLLRLVCQHANIRIRPIALRYLDIITRTQLQRLLLLGVPNAPYLRVVSLRTVAPYSVLKAFFVNFPTERTALQTLVLDDHATPPGVPIYDWRAIQVALPGSLTDLSLTSFGARGQAFGYLLRYTQGHMESLKRLAIYGVPLGVLLMPALEDLAISVRIAPDMDDALQASLANCPSLRRVRLLFISDKDGSQISASQKRTLLSNIRSDLVVDQLVPPLVEDKGAGFAERVQDGTIWTCKADFPQNASSNVSE